MTFLFTSPGATVGLVHGVRVVSPAPREVWAQALAADPLALPTQTPEWTDLTCRALGGVDASRMYEFPDGRLAVLPLVGRSWAGMRVTEESMPYGFGYGGLLVPGGRATEHEISIVLADLAQRPVLRAALYPSPLAGKEWSAAALPGTVHVEHLSHLVDLKGGFGAVFARYRSDMRRNVKKAGKQTLDVREVRDASLADIFAGLNAQSVDRWAQQRGQPLWMARLVERRRDRVRRLRVALAGSSCLGWTAHQDGVPIAAYVALFHQDSAFFWMSAINKELADRTRAGALLQSLAIEHACTAGVRWFHLGESNPGSGVARFKEGFGAMPMCQDVLRFERLPLTAADRRLHDLAARMAAGRRSGGAAPVEPSVAAAGGPT
jgi:GNAT acetyltransferase-like protein